MQKSRGHVAFIRDHEYLHGPDGTLYVAPSRNPLDLDGYRQGARFACMPRQDGHAAFLEGVRAEYARVGLEWACEACGSDCGAECTTTNWDRACY